MQSVCQRFALNLLSSFQQLLVQTKVQLVVFPLKLVRPGMQISARMPRAALNPPIPPQSTAAAAVGGLPMPQQVFVPGLTSDPCLSCLQCVSTWLIGSLLMTRHRYSSIL